MIGLAGENGRHKINARKVIKIVCIFFKKENFTKIILKNIFLLQVQERWMHLHMRRKRESRKSKQELRMDRISKSILKMEDPKISMNLEDLIGTLPKTRTQRDFLSVSEGEILMSVPSNPNRASPSSKLRNTLFENNRK